MIKELQPQRYAAANLGTKRIAHPPRRGKGLLDAPFAVPGFHMMGSGFDGGALGGSP